MNRLNHYSFVLVILLAACASSGETTQSEDKAAPKGAVVISNNSARSLADYLRRVPGVSVKERGSRVSVNIHGPSSFTLSTEPLYVLDGNPLGNDYDAANSIINVNDIDYVRVLKGGEASFYGLRGGNGVILITTKKN